jgi:hypothetical protein
VWGEDTSNVTVIPVQNRLTQPILIMFQHFNKDLKQSFVVSHRTDQFPFRAQQRVVTTVEDSILRTEMTSLESQEEDTPRRVLYLKRVVVSSSILFPSS